MAPSSRALWSPRAIPSASGPQTASAARITAGHGTRAGAGRTTSASHGGGAGGAGSLPGFLTTGPHG